MGGYKRERVKQIFILDSCHGNNQWAQAVSFLFGGNV